MDWPWHDDSAADAKTLFNGEISPAILDYAQSSHPVILDGSCGCRVDGALRSLRPRMKRACPPFHFERDEVMAYLQQLSITTPDWRFEVDVPSNAWMMHDVRRD
jgi:hypothetical protein